MAFYDWILPVLREVFNQEAPKLPSELQTSTLAEFSNLLTFSYTLKSHAGKLTPIRIADEECYAESMIPYVSDPQHAIRKSFPIVRPEDVTMI